MGPFLPCPAPSPSCPGHRSPEHRGLSHRPNLGLIPPHLLQWSWPSPRAGMPRAPILLHRPLPVDGLERAWGLRHRAESTWEAIPGSSSELIRDPSQRAVSPMSKAWGREPGWGRLVLCGSGGENGPVALGLQACVPVAVCLGVLLYRTGPAVLRDCFSGRSGQGPPCEEPAPEP